jgi:hypothetical protein
MNSKRKEIFQEYELLKDLFFVLVNGNNARKIKRIKLF